MNWGEGSGEDVTGENEIVRNLVVEKWLSNLFQHPKFSNNNLEQNPNMCNR